MINRSYTFKSIESFVCSVENDLRTSFEARSNEVYKQLKFILNIFKEEKVSTCHFQQSTGIGYNDISREIIDKVFAKLFRAESAAVRMQLALYYLEY